MSIIYRLVFAPPAFFHIAFYGIDFSHNSYLITFEFHTVSLWRDQKESSSIIIHLLDPFDPSFNEVDVLVNYCTMCVCVRARACLTRKRGCEATNACLYFKSNLAQRQVDPPLLLLLFLQETTKIYKTWSYRLDCCVVEVAAGVLWEFRIFFNTQLAVKIWILKKQKFTL